MQVLRPQLYHQLQLQFGEVKISKAGEEIQWKVRTENDGTNRRYFEDNSNDGWGEYYRVCCPHCNDRKFRLSINYMWGYPDEETHSQNLWLMTCHHQNCFSTYLQQKFFYESLFSKAGPIVRHQAPLRGIVKAKKAGEAEWPGTVWPIHRLPEDHAAVTYLQGRRFDAAWLWDRFRVGFLIEPRVDLGHLRGRIIIPLFFHEKLVGWQARLVRPPVGDERKYMTMEGMPRGSLLYNFDSAKQFPFVVVVEGPVDVWRFGPEAVAVMGTYTSHQAQLIQANWKKVVILLDGDALDKSHDLFELMRRTRTEVAEVRLPEDMDPGDFETTAWLRKYVAEQLALQNFSLC